MRHFTLFLFLVVLASACAPTYVPNTRNVPLFAEAEEFQGSVYVTTGLEAQLAYALTDHLAIMGNYSLLSEKNSAQKYTRKNNYYEGGLGYFNAGRSRIIEVFAGFGQGNGTAEAQYNFFFPFHGQADVLNDYKYQRLFIQPSIGTNNRKFNIAFTPRISLVDFTQFKSSLATIKPDEKAILFVEPALTGKFHLMGNLKGVFQLGLNVGVASDVYFTNVPLQAAFGIQLDVGNRLRTRVY